MMVINIRLRNCLNPGTAPHIKSTGYKSP